LLPVGILNKPTPSVAKIKPMRDDFSEEVKRTLASRVNNHCSNPDCDAPTSGPQIDSTKALNVGVAAHITAASLGGPRYNPLLTPEQRGHSNNGIHLCQNCAKLVDNDPSQFPEELLRAWKVVSEHRARTSIGKTGTHLRTHESESQKLMRKILEWKDKNVTLAQMTPPQHVASLGPKRGSSFVVVLDCTEDYVTVGAKVGVTSVCPRIFPPLNLLMQ
jgi:hypothetical protein